MLGGKMKTIKEVLEFAIKNEDDAYHLYHGVAQKAKKAEIKTAFEDMAKDEKGHKVELQELLQSENMSDFQHESVQDLKISDHMVESQITPESDMTDILVFAMKEEKKAQELYMGMAEKADNPDLTKAFQKLSNMELSHKNRLERIYEDNVYLEN